MSAQPMARKLKAEPMRGKVRRQVIRKLLYHEGDDALILSPRIGQRSSPVAHFVGTEHLFRESVPTRLDLPSGAYRQNRFSTFKLKTPIHCEYLPPPSGHFVG